MMQELHDHNLFSANSVGEVTEGVMLCRAPLKIDFLYITDIEPNSTDQDFSLNDLVNSCSLSIFERKMLSFACNRTHLSHDSIDSFLDLYTAHHIVG